MALQDTLEQLQNFDVSDLDVNNIGSWPGPVKAHPHGAGVCAGAWRRLLLLPDR